MIRCLTSYPYLCRRCGQYVCVWKSVCCRDCVSMLDVSRRYRSECDRRSSTRHHCAMTSLAGLKLCQVHRLSMRVPCCSFGCTLGIADRRYKSCVQEPLNNHMDMRIFPQICGQPAHPYFVILTFPVKRSIWAAKGTAFQFWRCQIQHVLRRLRSPNSYRCWVQLWSLSMVRSCIAWCRSASLALVH